MLTGTFRAKAMTLIDIMGYIAATLTAAAFLPQAILVIKTRDTDAISPVTYAMYTIGVSLWLVYGIATQAWPIAISNSVTLTCSVTILWITLENKIRRRRMILA